MSAYAGLIKFLPEDGFHSAIVVTEDDVEVINVFSEYEQNSDDLEQLLEQRLQSLDKKELAKAPDKLEVVMNRLFYNNMFETQGLAIYDTEDEAMDAAYRLRNTARSELGEDS